MPVSLDEDNILDDLIQELDNSPKPGNSKLFSKVNEKIKRENQTR